MRATDIIVVASLNEDKLLEFKKLYEEFPHLQFMGLNEVVFNPSRLSEVEAQGKSYYENAYNKGRLAHLAGKYPTFADDTGLEVDALNGRPGIYSHRYAIPRAGETQDMANNKKLLQELKDVPMEKRTARFVCTLVFFVEGVVLSATETMEGTLIEAPRGDHGFGYDPLFLVRDTDKTLAQMTLEEKNKISHRAKAFRSLVQQIKSKNVALVRP